MNNHSEKQILVFASHKMSGLPENEVIKIREDILNYLTQKYGNVKLIDNYNHQNVPEDAGRLWHLGTSIRQMEKADAIYFHESCENSNGCIIEKKICELYGLKVID